jgi:hypothetical protein
MSGGFTQKTTIIVEDVAMQLVNSVRPLRFETLEARRMLSASKSAKPAKVTQPAPSGGTVVVAPLNGLAPILLPPGSETPSHASSLPVVDTGELPAGLPNIAGQAEQLALNLFSTFQAAHPKAKVKVSDNLSKTGAYTLTLTATDGKGHSFTETITESMTGVMVAMSLVDGQHSEYVVAAQSVTGAMNAVLTDAVFDNGHFTSNQSELQINGHLTSRQW